MKTRVLRLHLKAKYWHEVKRGEKLYEYRLANDYWERRLRGSPYDEVHLLLGYPKSGDESKIMKFRWITWPQQITLMHPEWDNKPKQVYAISLLHPKE